MTDLEIKYMGHTVKLSDVDFTPGQESIFGGPPEAWEEGSPAEIDYKYNTGNELLNLLLKEYHDEAIAEIAIKTIITMSSCPG